VELRESQYRQKFAETDGSWFCFVAARQNGELVGFAVGAPADPPEDAGHVDKIYVLRNYQRLGLGRRLLAHLAERFLSQGYSSMTLFSQAENPSIWFFDAMGGQRLSAANGEFHGGYRWRDIRPLSASPE
jgi:ribosomal protein S18 acetylase RimI-like enzyme